MLPSADIFMEMLIKFFSRTWHQPTLPHVPNAGSVTMMLLGVFPLSKIQDNFMRTSWYVHIWAGQTGPFLGPTEY